MFKFIIFVAVFGTAGFLFPQLYEGTSDACTAIEAKAVRALNVTEPEAAAGLRIASRLSNGELARAKVAEDYPSLPGGLGCVVGYYDFDMDGFRR